MEGHTEQQGGGGESVGTANSKLQPRLLKAIMSLRTKEDLLAHVERSIHLLDAINLVTCLYRLARMYGFVHTPAQRTVWRNELLRHDSCTLLLGAIHSHLTQAQALLATAPDAKAAATGLNARCLSNLIWSLVKLESVAQDGHPLALEVVCAASPLVLVYLEDCSGQGLANLLWSYAKIPASHSQVMTAIVLRMVNLLQDKSTAHQLDAQALSNSIWAIAHVRSRPNDVDSLPSWQEGVTSFLLLMANQALEMLKGLVNNEQPYAMQSSAARTSASTDSRFSCQALVNFVWSFSAILGSACGVQDPVRPLFLLIRQLAIVKLQTSLGTGLALQQPWVYSLSGTFNEQALANLVFAYDKAGLLDAGLLQAVLDVAASRINTAAAAGLPGSTQHGGPLPFKPQELCTLLRACHTRLADPLPFLSAVGQVLAQHPLATSGFNNSEAAEVARSMQLLHKLMAEQQVQQLQAPATHPQRAVLNLPSGSYLPPQVPASAAALMAPPGTTTTLQPADYAAPQQQQQQQLWLYQTNSILHPHGPLVLGSSAGVPGPAASAAVLPPMHTGPASQAAHSGPAAQLMAAVQQPMRAAGLPQGLPAAAAGLLGSSTQPLRAPLSGRSISIGHGTPYMVYASAGGAALPSRSFTSPAATAALQAAPPASNPVLTYQYSSPAALQVAPGTYAALPSAQQAPGAHAFGPSLGLYSSAPAMVHTGAPAAPARQLSAQSTSSGRGLPFQLLGGDGLEDPLAGMAVGGAPQLLFTSLPSAALQLQAAGTGAATYQASADAYFVSSQGYAASHQQG